MRIGDRGSGIRGFKFIIPPQSPCTLRSTRGAVHGRAAHGAVGVSVRDTGPGIAAEDLPKIFDRFYKGKASRGSGLGLTIARNLVAAHGGSIRAESEAGAGTTLTFALPLDVYSPDGPERFHPS